MRFFGLLLIFLQFFAKILAQPSPEILEIDQLYQQLNRQTAKDELYMNENRYNADRFALHSPQYFQKFERFYYALSPRDRRTTLLRSVIVRIERNQTHYHHEYIFDTSGRVVYYMESIQSKSTRTDHKIRAYLRNGQILRWFNHTEELDEASQSAADKARQILQEATQYHKKFAEQMNDILR